ncbi:hypothetical protein DI458_00065, partial [Burkholderia contaminans]
ALGFGLLPSAVCRLPSAVCRLPSAVCRLPSAVCRLPYGVWRMAYGVCRLAFCPAAQASRPHDLADPRAAARDMRRHNSRVAHHVRPPHTCACVLRNGMKPLPSQRSRPASDRSRS